MATQNMQMQTFVAGFCAGAGAKAGSVGYSERVAPTLKGLASGNSMPSVLCVSDQGGEAVDRPEGDFGMLRHGQARSSGSAMFGQMIRRLTPLECERLQGYPDGWTELPDASDSSRYRALGNSVAVPCVEYLIGGIAKAMRCGIDFSRLRADLITMDTA